MNVPVRGRNVMFRLSVDALPLTVLFPVLVTENDTVSTPSTVDDEDDTELDELPLPLLCDDIVLLFAVATAGINATAAIRGSAVLRNIFMNHLLMNRLPLKYSIASGSF